MIMMPNFGKKCRFYKKKIETIPYTRQLRKDIQGLIIADKLIYEPAFCSYFIDFILLSKTGIPLLSTQRLFSSLGINAQANQFNSNSQSLFSNLKNIPSSLTYIIFKTTDYIQNIYENPNLEGRAKILDERHTDRQWYPSVQSFENLIIEQTLKCVFNNRRCLLYA